MTFPRASSFSVPPYSTRPLLLLNAEGDCHRMDVNLGGAGYSMQGLSVWE